MTEETRIARVEPQALTPWEEMQQQARLFIGSGFLPKQIKTEGQALAIMQMGREIGIGPMAAMQRIHFIETKENSSLSIAPEIALAMIRRSGLLADMQIQSSDGVCTVTMWRKGQKSPVKKTFTREMAKKAGLFSKWNWSAWEGQLLQWRAIGFCIDALFSDITWGLGNPDEMGAITTAEGTVIIDTITGEVLTEQEETHIEAEATVTPTEEPPAQKPAPEYDAATLRAMELWTRTKRSGCDEKTFRSYLEQQFGERSAKALTVEQVAFWEGQLIRVEAEHTTWAEILEASRFAQEKAEPDEALDELPDDEPLGQGTLISDAPAESEHRGPGRPKGAADSKPRQRRVTG